LGSVHALRTTQDFFSDTLSGARIRPICAPAFGPLLAQFGEIGAAAASAHVVWGAFVEDDLIGVAYLDRVHLSSTGAGVAVSPARRHLGIAKDLLQCEATTGHPTEGARCGFVCCGLRNP
jgi:GNAT superfamily N-acetyltransferase